MKPTKQSVYQIFDREIRYTVPLFQRSYVWNEDTHWQPLWADIERQAILCLTCLREEKEPEKSHFLGAVVVNVSKFIGLDHPRADIIDGQQRLTTLQIFLAAARDYAQSVGHVTAGSADRLTKNPADDSRSEQRFKVWPSRADQDDFVKVMTAGSPEALRKIFTTDESTNDGYPRMAQAYAYFYKAIKAFAEKYAVLVNASGSDHTPLTALMVAFKKPLELIAIELEVNDDPQVIFECLNARGQPLLPSDLIRNYIFMKAASRDIYKLYDDYWKAFDETRVEERDGNGEDRFWHQEERQGRLQRPRIDLFVFHYLTMKTAGEDDLQIGSLYQSFKDWYSKCKYSVEPFLKDLANYRVHFSRLINPGNNDRLDIFACRLKSLDTSTVYPILLFLMGLPEESLYREDRDKIICNLESWLVRRFVCGLTTKNYNNFFLALLKKIQAASKAKTSLSDCVCEELGRSTESTSRWPADDEFLKGWLNTEVYTKSRPDRSAMLLLAMNYCLRSTRTEKIDLEESSLSVEHLLPQKAELEDYPFSEKQSLKRTDETNESFRKRLSNTVGNLTLLTQPLNSSISNGPFKDKIEAIINDSDLRLNAEFRKDTPSLWNEEDVKNRAERLFNEALKIWPRLSSFNKVEA